jgi:hypothetical protein
MAAALLPWGLPASRQHVPSNGGSTRRGLARPALAAHESGRCAL